MNNNKKPYGDKRQWQLILFNKSIKKKEKLELINRNIPPIKQEDKILDLGCAKGTISYFLRQKGGKWISADLDWENLKATKELVDENVLQIDALNLPFKEESLDGIVSLDFLEHIQDDERCFSEIIKLLKPDGWLLLSVPRISNGLILNRIKKYIGLKPSVYGHLREGYADGEILNMVKSENIKVEMITTYSRFFSELVEMLINFLYIFVLKKKNGKKGKRDGNISPGSEADFQAHKKTLKFYSIIYPFTYLLTRLDKLLFFLRGYAILLRGRKEKSKLGGEK